MKVTRFEDAKALRAMGVPINTPVIDRELSAKAEKKLSDVFNATSQFGDAVTLWVQKQTGKRYAAMGKTWCDLYRALMRARRLIESNSDPEAMAVAAFVTPCDLVCLQWDEILSELEDGKEQTNHDWRRRAVAIGSVPPRSSQF